MSTIAGDIEDESIPDTLPFKLSIVDANLGAKEWSAKYALPFSIDMALTAMASGLACEGVAPVSKGAFVVEVFDVASVCDCAMYFQKVPEIYPKWCMS